MMKLFLVTLLLISGCTTHSYFRDNGERITVKKFLGIPYLEEDKTTESVPTGQKLHHGEDSRKHHD